MKVLIAFDGSDCAKGALQDLRRAGFPNDTEVLVLSVAELLIDVDALGPDDPANASMSRMVRQARALAREAIANARQTSASGAALVRSCFPSWRVESAAEADSPYAAIVRKAEEWSADVVVVGSHGRSPLGRMILGSISQKVLAYAPCSVRVGRCGELKGSRIPLADDPVKILLAVDGSSDSSNAADAVRMRAWPKGTEIRIVTSVDLKALGVAFVFGVDLGAAEQESMSIFRSRLDAVARDLRQAGLSADSEVLDGDPKRSIVQEAEKWGADCIVMGAKGHGRIERFVLGSVSAAVAARAHCSVEVVRTR